MIRMPYVALQQIVTAGVGFVTTFNCCATSDPRFELSKREAKGEITLRAIMAGQQITFRTFCRLSVDLEIHFRQN